jgi:hypothetical protein
MLELIQNLTNSFGTKELETSQEELELEFLVKELKNKEKVVNGILLSNILTLKISLVNSLKKLKYQLDLMIESI